MKRLYRSIEDGIVELDDILRERSASLKAQRERAKAALDHARAECGMAAAVNAEKFDAFARMMNTKLVKGDTNTRKSYIRLIIDAVEVDDHAIRIVGSKDILQAAIAGKHRERKCRWFCTQMARPKGFEPLTPRFVVWCSIQLSYGRLCRGSRRV